MSNDMKGTSGDHTQPYTHMDLFKVVNFGTPLPLQTPYPYDRDLVKLVHLGFSALYNLRYGPAQICSLEASPHPQTTT